mmetsp:Transcript_55438/g.145979  ORF Transcript_55438/g.145979 Transcript_55438/m.145979 type:complete len:253 (+) Transcript_55438:139-897(+)
MLRALKHLLRALLQLSGLPLERRVEHLLGLAEPALHPRDLLAPGLLARPVRFVAPLLDLLHVLVVLLLMGREALLCPGEVSEALLYPSSCLQRRSVGAGHVRAVPLEPGRALVQEVQAGLRAHLLRGASGLLQRQPQRFGRHQGRGGEPMRLVVPPLQVPQLRADVLLPPTPLDRGVRELRLGARAGLHRGFHPRRQGLAQVISLPGLPCRVSRLRGGLLARRGATLKTMLQLLVLVGAACESLLEPGDAGG